MADFKPLIAKAATGEALTRAEAETAFDIMMSGQATPTQIGAFLMAPAGSRRDSRRDNRRSFHHAGESHPG